MSWNYRILKKDNTYSIHEVYYDENYIVEKWTSNNCLPFAKSEHELKNIYEKFIMKAFDKPVIDEETGKEIIENGS